eukprot:SAG11_NODE_10540_length_823_cov_1.390884_1_plen_54_part_10
MIRGHGCSILIMIALVAIILCPIAAHKSFISTVSHRPLMKRFTAATMAALVSFR